MAAHCPQTCRKALLLSSQFGKRYSTSTKLPSFVMTPTHEKFWLNEWSDRRLMVGITENGLDELNDVVKIEPLVESTTAILPPISPVCQVNWESFCILDKNGKIGWECNNGSRYINTFPCKTKLVRFNEPLMTNPSLITGLGDEWLMELELVEPVSFPQLLKSGVLLSPSDYAIFCGKFDTSFAYN